MLRVTPETSWKRRYFADIVHWCMDFDFSNPQDPPKELFRLYHSFSNNPPSFMEAYVEAKRRYLGDGLGEPLEPFHLLHTLEEFILYVAPSAYSTYLYPWYKAHAEEIRGAAERITLLSTISSIFSRPPPQPENKLLISLLVKDAAEKLGPRDKVYTSTTDPAARQTMDNLRKLFKDTRGDDGFPSREEVGAVWRIFARLHAHSPDCVLARLERLFSPNSFPVEIDSYLRREEFNDLDTLLTHESLDRFSSVLVQFTSWFCQNRTCPSVHHCTTYVELLRRCMEKGWRVRFSTLRTMETQVQEKKSGKKSENYSADEQREEELLQKGVDAENWLKEEIRELAFNFIVSKEGFVFYKELTRLLQVDFWNNDAVLDTFKKGSSSLERIQKVQEQLSHLLERIKEKKVTLSSLMKLAACCDIEPYSLLERFFPNSPEERTHFYRECIDSVIQEKKTIIERNHTKYIELFNELLEEDDLPEMLKKHLENEKSAYADHRTYCEDKCDLRDVHEGESGKIYEFQNSNKTAEVSVLCGFIQEHRQCEFVKGLLRDDPPLEGGNLHDVLQKYELFVIEGCKKIRATLFSDNCTLSDLNKYAGAFIPQTIRMDISERYTWEGIKALGKDGIEKAWQRFYGEMMHLDLIISTDTARLDPLKSRGKWRKMFTALLLIAYKEEATQLLALADDPFLVLDDETRSALQHVTSPLEGPLREMLSNADVLVSHAGPFELLSGFPLGYCQWFNVEFIETVVLQKTTKENIVELEKELALTAVESAQIQHVKTVLSKQDKFKRGDEQVDLLEFMSACGEECGPSIMYLCEHEEEVRLLLQDDRRLMRAANTAQELIANDWVFTLESGKNLTDEFTFTARERNGKKSLRCDQIRAAASELRSHGYARTDEDTKAKFLIYCDTLNELCHVSYDLLLSGASSVTELTHTESDLTGAGEGTAQLELQARQSKQVEWKAHMAKQQKEYPPLNLLSATQLCKWRSLLADGSKEAARAIFLSMLPFQYTIEDDDLPPLRFTDEWLSQLGEKLTNAVARYCEKQALSRDVKSVKEALGKSLKSLGEYSVVEKRDRVLLQFHPKNTSGIPIWAISAYLRNFERLPYYFEVLQCTPHTEREEVNRFLQSWFEFTRSTGGGKYLFTVLNPEALSHSVLGALKVSILHHESRQHELMERNTPTLMLCGSVEGKHVEQLGLGKWEEVEIKPDFMQFVGDWVRKVLVTPAAEAYYGNGSSGGLRDSVMWRYVDKDFDALHDPCFLEAAEKEYKGYVLVNVKDESDLVRQLLTVASQRSQEEDDEQLFVRLSFDPSTDVYTKNKVMLSFLLFGRVTSRMGAITRAARDVYCCTVLRDDSTQIKTVLDVLLSPDLHPPRAREFAQRYLSIITHQSAATNATGEDSVIFRPIVKKDTEGFMALQAAVYAVQRTVGRLKAFPSYEDLLRAANGRHTMPSYYIAAGRSPELLTTQQVFSFLAYFLYNTPQSSKEMSSGVFEYVPKDDVEWSMGAILSFYRYMRQSIMGILHYGPYEKPTGEDKSALALVEVAILDVLCSGHHVLPEQEESENALHWFYHPTAHLGDQKSRLIRFEGKLKNSTECLLFGADEKQAEGDDTITAPLKEKYTVIHTLSLHPEYGAELEEEAQSLSTGVEREWKRMKHIHRIVTGQDPNPCTREVLRSSFDLFSDFVSGKSGLGNMPPVYLSPFTLEQLCRIKEHLLSGVTALVTGDTASGKTVLALYYAVTCGLPFSLLTCQPSMLSVDLERELFQLIQKHNGECIIILDEINQLPDPWLARELMVGRVLYGRRLPSNVHLIATRNPARDFGGSVLKHSLPMTAAVHISSFHSIILPSKTAAALVRQHVLNMRGRIPLPQGEEEKVANLFSTHSETKVYAKTKNKGKLPHISYMVGAVVYDLCFEKQTHLADHRGENILEILGIDPEKHVDMWSSLCLILLDIITSSPKGDGREAGARMVRLWKKAFLYYFAIIYKISKDTTKTYEWLKKPSDVLMSVCIVVFCVSWGMRYEESERVSMMGRIREQFGMDVYQSSKGIFTKISGSIVVFPSNVDGNRRMIEMFLAMLFTNYGGVGNNLFLLGPPGAGKTLSIHVQQWATGSDSGKSVLKVDIGKPLRPLSVQCTPDTTPEHIRKIAESVAEIDKVGGFQSVLILDEVSRMNGSKFNALCELRQLIDNGVYIEKRKVFQKINIICISNEEIESTTMDRFLVVRTLKSGLKDMVSTATTLNKVFQSNQWERLFTELQPWFDQYTKGIDEGPPQLTQRDLIGFINTLTLLSK
ncbi:hypothetical protein ADEAN_000111800 [Angomonas deanei]|uniref:AAA+ ATPase domain-containing protein n=1 Tax=Angomonas deanei TaxID=59799 RepID=A0A7G2C2A6_9TRYP|nr:hypothetical protein ADEAN_000111800 [Angomonas deanei]